jgi:Fe2+ or Zn2+ uptake regulation protein
MDHEHIGDRGLPEFSVGRILQLIGGLLRLVAIDSSKSYFDTNNTEHHHYYLEDRHEVMDIPPTDVAVGKVPAPPAGYEVVRINVVVRLRRKTLMTRRTPDAPQAP